MVRIPTAPHVRLITALSLALLLLGLVPAPRVAAQTTSGTLFGQIVDPTGNPVADAKVTATNQTNGNSRSTVSGADGTYRIPFLPPGLYSISATKLGFGPAAINDYRIPLNSTTNLVPPITLASTAGPTTPTGPTNPTGPTGPTGPTIPVVPQVVGESRGQLVNLSDPTRRGNFTEIQVETLPLGGTTETRTFDEYALLVAGVAPPPYTPGVRGPGIGIGVGTAGQFSVNGSRARSNNFTVDGSDNNDPDVGVRRQGFVSLVPQPIESIQEFQLSTLIWDSELGRNVGSQVNAVSKSGGNQVHGQVYGFFTDSSLNARNFFDYEGGASQGENPYTRTQAGFVIGGPIVRDRTQFFGSFEHQDINSAVEQHFAVPTAGERTLGPFVVLNPSFGLATFFTPLGASPVGRQTLAAYPLPNNPGGPYGANTYSEVLPSNGDGLVASFKVTHQFNENHALNVRYNFTNDDRVLPSVNQAIRSSINAEAQTHNFAVIFDSALRTNLFNQARFSFGRTRLDFPEYPTSPFTFENRGQDVINLDGVPTIFESTTGEVGQITIDPFSPVGVDVFTFPQGRRNNTFQFADSMSWTKHGHSMKFGFDIRHTQLNSFQDRNYRPAVTYQQGIQVVVDPTAQEVTGGPFLLPGVLAAAVGLPASIRQTLTLDVPNSAIGLRFTEYDFFWTDNWRVRPNFVLDFGVRYEYNTVPTEVNNRIEDALAVSNIPGPEGSLIGQAFGQDVLNFFVSEFGDAVNAYRGVVDGRTKIYDNDPNNFAPHIGFAWDPWQTGKTSIRGGYAVAFDTILGAVVSQSRNVFPTEIPLTIDATTLGFNVFNLNVPSNVAVFDPRFPNDRVVLVPIVAPGTLNQFGGGGPDFQALFGALFGFTLEQGGAGGLAFTLPAKDLATPYTQQWHLTLEREVYTDYLLSAAYVGTKGT
jgi:hypothetical protein